MGVGARVTGGEVTQLGKSRSYLEQQGQSLGCGHCCRQRDTEQLTQAGHRNGATPLATLPGLGLAYGSLGQAFAESRASKSSGLRKSVTC